MALIYYWLSLVNESLKLSNQIYAVTYRFNKDAELQSVYIFLKKEFSKGVFL